MAPKASGSNNKKKDSKGKAPARDRDVEDPERQQLLATEDAGGSGDHPEVAPATANGVPHHEAGHQEDLAEEKEDNWKTLVRSMINVTNLYGVFLCAFFFMLGMVLMLTPARHYKNKHEAEFVTHTNRSFWFVQGMILQFLSLKAAVATIYCAVLGRDPRNIRTGFFRKKLMIYLGSFVSEAGRALFYITAGVYVTPLMQIFGMMAEIDNHWVWFSYYAGITSIGSGLFLIVFDVVFDCCLRDPNDDREDSYYEYWGWPRPPHRWRQGGARETAAAE
eukprot:TRINITY_DN3503_c1_g1_i1.p1 TRINITY_DN3503_c1_g1~~TRINITY_DN3503_c1_g1_i1.p1  ORF type:complete len:308 (-),score=61.45 TRINITY_DN3503_c1_g1_i1:200-1030(-)